MGQQKILDAGCGFGQWTAALARHNEKVVGIDVDPVRLELAAKLWTDVPNAEFRQSRLEAMPLESESVDAAFCYSVIYFTDPAKTLRELYRVLKPQGRLYICTNGWGWFLYNFLERHNPSLDFNPRTYALQTTVRTLWYYLTGRFMKGRAIATPSWYMRRLLKRTGFSVLALQGEGTINFDNGLITPNYKPRYKGLENIYEFIAVKS
ncbi:MAG: class I SAM-dependent methyltransferase [Chloroflexi bacterium]|nr:class I SAM-dependent methyltransferase [Chloroflexota bacterium]